MAKPKQKQVAKKDLIPSRYQDWLSIFTIAVVVIVFFWGAITSGGFVDFDNLASWSFKPYLEEASREGRFPQWIPLLFSGMPAYASLLVTGNRAWDIIAEIFINVSVVFGQIFGSDVARVLFFYILYGIGIYWLLRYKKFPKTASLFASFAAIFSTYVITWIMIGHNTKPIVVAMFPYVILFVEKLKERFNFLHLGLLITAIAIMFIGNHLQMIFYGGIMFAIYLIYNFIAEIIKKEKPLRTLRSAILLAVAYIVAFSMSADRYLSTLEYAPYSVRGSAPIEKVHKDKTQKQNQSDYDYATMWSYSPEELFTFLVPSYFGFGVRDYRESKISTYWGQKESEDSPPYMGVLVLGLAVLGLVYFRKDTFVQALFIILLVGIFLSFGKNLPFLYNLFYNYFPSFSKFRAPSMALVLVHFTIPILSVYGFWALKKMHDEGSPRKTNFWLIFIPFLFLFFAFIFSAVFKTTYLSAVGSSDVFKQIAQAYGQDVVFELQEFIWKNTIEDWYLNAIFLLGGGTLAVLYINKKLKYATFFTIIALITMLDLFRVDARRMEYSKERSFADVFSEREDVYNFIKQDKTIFRIADFSVNPANMTAYYLVENVNGYHAAKLRIYQDLMDVANIEGMEGSTSQLYNPFLWNLLNVKYLVFNRKFEGVEPIYQSQRVAAFVYPNYGMLERAFFVKNAVVSKPLDILQHLKKGDFNPLDTVFVENPLNVQTTPPDSSSKVKFLTKQNEYLKLETETPGNHILFLSEVYYPPAWKAYVDGREVKIIKANYAFRAIVVPQGRHIVEFKYHSNRFELGRTLSIIGNATTLLLIAFGIFWSYRKEKKIRI